MQIAALQMVSGTDCAANLRTARQWIDAAARAGAELAVLPEYFCLLGADPRDKLAIAEAPGDGPIQRMLATAARETGIWVAGGTLPLRAPQTSGRVFNSTLVFAPDGSQAARYDKLHLFRFDDGHTAYDEAATLLPGAAPAWFDLRARDGHVWRVGLSICYDLRFPELYRAYAAAGCTLLLAPSAFTHVTGAAHWELLLRARAVENLAYVCAAAQGGLHANGRRTWGHSMVVDAWGGVLAACAGDGCGMALATLHAQALADTRARLPALGHRRL